MTLKRVALTGGTGFIGANLARRLLSDGCEVHLFVRPGYSQWRIEPIREQLAMHEVDLTDQADANRVMDHLRPDWIFHLAAHGGYSWQTDLNEMIGTNYVGTVNLISAAMRVGFEAFINAGSSSEYGLKDHAPSEDELPEPNSGYAATKLAGTLFCQYAAKAHGVRLRTLRLYSVYGPFEDPKRLIPSLIRCGLQGKLPPLVDPKVARDFVYVEDACEAFIRAAASPDGDRAGIYNVGTGIQTTIAEAVDIACGLLGNNCTPVWGSMDNRLWDTQTWMADSNRAHRELGWSPAYSFERGFAATLRWHHANPNTPKC